MLIFSNLKMLNFDVVVNLSFILTNYVSALKLIGDLASLARPLAPPPGWVIMVAVVDILIDGCCHL